MAIAYLLIAMMSGLASGIYHLANGGSVAGAFGLAVLVGQLVMISVICLAYLRSQRRAVTPRGGEKSHAKAV